MFKPLFPSEIIDFNSNGSIHVYTDGACLRNGQPHAACGWGYVCIQRDKKYSQGGGWNGGTNNQAEITAAIEGLKCAGKLSYAQPVTLYSDSKYVIETLKGEYSINKNQGLWQQLITEVRKFNHIQFIWVKGHADNPYNIEVDRIASEYAKLNDTYK